MKKRMLIGIFLISLMGVPAGFAQETNGVAAEKPRNEEQPADTTSNRYGRKEQWFVQAQGGGNYMFAENIRFDSFYKGTAMSYAVAAGKLFTPVWGMRMRLFGGGDKGKYYSTKGSGPGYSFSHIGGAAEVTFNLLNCFRDNEKEKEEQSPWDLYLMLGPGVVHTYNFDRKGEEYDGLDTTPRNHFMLYGGAELLYRFDRHWGLSLEVSTGWMRDKYNGVVYDRGLDGHLNVLLGVKYVFGKNDNTNNK